MRWPSTIRLRGIMAPKLGTVDPRKFPAEAFDLYSVPAFDSGQPEVVAGLQVGSAKQVVQPGDVLLSRIVPHIRRAWIVGENRGRRIIASGEWIVFRDDRFHSGYLRHVLTGDQFHAQFMRTVSGVGGSLLRARPSHVAEITIPLPPLPEQRRIAAILDKADALRRKRQKSLTILDELLRSAYDALVGPGASACPTWPAYRIVQLAQDQSGSMRTGPFGSGLRHSEFVDSGVAVLGIDNVVHNRFEWGERRYILPEKYEQLRRYTVFPGDVLVTIMGTVGRSAVVPDGIPVAISTKHLASITVDRKRVEPSFLSHAIHSDRRVLAQILAANRGAIMPGLNLGIIKDLSISLPPIAAQRAFDEVVREVEQLRGLGHAALEAATTLFRSLSRRAFQGHLSG